MIFTSQQLQEDRDVDGRAPLVDLYRFDRDTRFYGYDVNSLLSENINWLQY